MNAKPGGSKPIQLRLDAETHLKLQQEAARQERSMTWLVNRILADALKALPPAPATS
ncbi:hypothetical protein SOM08_06050 [Hydrogenophaga sp. SNF1]|uniref:hypothetical protein n=1 Tax=Hydrogenophaga sp. SNF1 TaxID=3098762 RepID=UPI002ACC1853|nr:hypothetical protein [Hydrogenophaga sp. SNF1]WQB84873.1 hypothetical protein SOM08_06050 [Hydrogenophaga sp. SNF1]